MLAVINEEEEEVKADPENNQDFLLQDQDDIRLKEDIFVEKFKLLEKFVTWWLPKLMSTKPNKREDKNWPSE